MVRYNKENPLKVGTVCSGFDAQFLSLDRLKQTYPDFEYERTWWCEIDKYAIQLHDALFPDCADKNLGDLTKVDWTKVPKVDLFFFSTPCTSISAAGRQEGITEGSGTASSILWNCREAIRELRPKYLIQENVAALVQKKFMPEFQKWQKELEDFGYVNHWQLMNAKDYLTPQNRLRVFAVSIRDDGDNPQFVYPEPFLLEKRIKDIVETNVDESFYLKPDRLANLNIELYEQEDGSLIARQKNEQTENPVDILA